LKMNNSIFFRTRFCRSSFYRAIFLKSDILSAILCRGIIVFKSFQFIDFFFYTHLSIIFKTW
jgi:hypothetical protein